ncbi:MAG: hypothetical protein ABIO80_09160 [Sphingomicrobium sp.]
MATVAGKLDSPDRRPDVLTGTPRAHALDRWIFVAMAAWFIVIVLTGFVPDSMMKVAMVKAGARPPFPPIMHIHAVLMGSFLLLLLAQSVMMATGRCALHKQVGIAAFVLVPALVVVGAILAPTMYHIVWDGAHHGPPPVQAALTPVVPFLENILLLQLSAGILFGLFMTMALRARSANSGFHKRMIFLATAVPLAAAIDRMWWLPSTLPASPIATTGYILLAVAPMLLWDVMRNRRVHEAYLVWAAIFMPVSLLVARLWDTPWWHATAQRIMGI